MPDAAAQLTRIVELVARLSRRADADGEGVPLADVARRLGVAPEQVQRDIRTLTELGDHADQDWLLSIQAWQQGDRVSVSSAGPFRRPVKFTPDELLALRVALSTERGGAELARRFAALAGEAEPPGPGTGVGTEAPAPAGWADVFQRGVAEGCRLELLYAGEADHAGKRWIVWPHQVYHYHGRTYLWAWCEGTDDWRHFRADRVLDAFLTGQTFQRRPDFQPVEGPGDVFRPGVPVATVRVRFSPAVARWARERYPEHEAGDDGSVTVALPVTSVEWLARRVLEYGGEAEVLEPPVFREAMRRAVGAVRR